METELGRSFRFLDRLRASLERNVPSIPRVVVWRPFLSIHSFDPSSPFPLILPKTKETNAFRFRRCIKLIVALIHTTSLHHILSHCILCKQDALSTRKYLYACARFRPAVTLRGPIEVCTHKT